MKQSLAIAALLAATIVPAHAAATLGLAIDGKNLPVGAASAQVKANDTTTIQISIKDGKADKLVQLPRTDGLVPDGRGGAPQPHVENIFFYVTAARTGPITIKPFDIRTTDGQVLHMGAIKLTAVK